MRDPNAHNPPHGRPRGRGAIVGGLAGLTLFIIVFSLSDLEMGVGRATLHPVHLVFASAVVVLSVYLFSRRRHSKSPEECSRTSPETPPSSSNMASLAIVALVGAPVLSLAVGLMCVALLDVHPMDRESVVFNMTALGFVVGTIVAVVLAVAGRLK